MRLLIIRHGDPDYEKDSLTPKGWKEAELLSERLCKMKIDAFYVSPLGRAKDTASLTLQKMNRTAEVCDWLEEFPATIQRPDTNGDYRVVWDWIPEDWKKIKEFSDYKEWTTPEPLQAGNVRQIYDRVTSSFDSLLARHGYVREENYYRAEPANRDTIALFCHFGLECALLSHLMGVSPMILWHHTCAAPSSVTTVYTEERRQGKAIFRMSSFGDISHLYAGDEEPAFAARFCETFDNKEERHD